MKTRKKPNTGSFGYCNRVQNPHPAYQVPESHYKKGRLAFIDDVVEKSKQVDVLLSDVAMWARKNNDKAKAFYKDRANAIRALVTCFVEHYNVVTGRCNISLRSAADFCGLSTISPAEKEKAEKDPTYEPKVNTSRATRAVQDMVDMGWIHAPRNWQIWDKARGHWIDKIFELTPLLFKAIGITPERLERQRTTRLKYLAKKNWLGLSADQIATMSISEIKEKERNVYVKSVFDRRKQKQAVAKLKRQMHGKSAEQQRNVAAARVIERLGAQVKCMSDVQFNQSVNQELAFIRYAIASPEPS